MAGPDWTPEMARDRNVDAIVGAAIAWRRSVALLHDAANADPASRDTHRWNTAVDVTGAALDRLCEAVTAGDSTLASGVRASSGDDDLLRRFVRKALDHPTS